MSAAELATELAAIGEHRWVGDRRSNVNVPLSSARHLTLAYLLAFTHKIKPFSARLERERVMLMGDRDSHNDTMIKTFHLM